MSRVTTVIAIIFSDVNRTLRGIVPVARWLHKHIIAVGRAMFFGYKIPSSSEMQYRFLLHQLFIYR